jgi:DNA-binding transcriptional ArsR family regulator
MPAFPVTVKRVHVHNPDAAIGVRIAVLARVRSGVILKEMLNYHAQLDRAFHALADPTRRLMLEQLSRGPASVSTLAEPFAMSLPAVLQHLQILEASGLVRSEKAGRVRTCRLEPTALRTAESWIAARRTSWESRLDRLGNYLAAQDMQPSKRTQEAQPSKRMQAVQSPNRRKR